MIRSVEDNSFESQTPEWMYRGKCRGMDPARFFPSNSVGVEVAQRVCEDCPVAAECLDYALEHQIENGIWGGASERRRRLILRRRRAAAASVS
jgi:WhiB family redox-sensing transcriptional regulator